MSKSRKKKRAPKRILALPDLEQSKAAVLNSLTSKSGQRSYDRAITDFVEWYCSEPRLAFNRTVVLRTGSFSNRSHTHPQPSTSGWQRSDGLHLKLLTAVYSTPELAAGIRRVKGVRRIGVRVGNWLTVEQSKTLLGCTSRTSLRG